MKINIIASLQNFKSSYTAKRATEPSLIVSAVEKGIAVNDPIRGVVPLMPSVEYINANGIKGLKTKFPVGDSDIACAKMVYEINANVQATGASTVAQVALPEAFSTKLDFWFVTGAHVENDTVSNVKIRRMPGSANTLEISFSGGSAGETFSIIASGYVDTI